MTILTTLALQVTIAIALILFGRCFLSVNAQVRLAAKGIPGSYEGLVIEDGKVDSEGDIVMLDNFVDTTSQAVSGFIILL